MVNTTDMALPGNLSYFLSRMQGVSTNYPYFKIFPNNTGTTPSKIFRFELPSNSLLNLRSLQLMFSASTTGATAGGRLPNKIDSLIERYALYAGGVLVSHGYNQARRRVELAAERKRAQQLTEALEELRCGVARAVTSEVEVQTEAERQMKAEGPEGWARRVGGCGDSWKQVKSIVKSRYV